MKRIFILSSIVLSVNLFAQKPTYITGIFGDSIVNALMGNHSLFMESDFYPLRSKKILKEGNICEEQLSVDTFQTAVLSVLAQHSTTYSRMQSIFITPGDSVSFVIDTIGRSIVFKFSGTNAAHYNFDYQLFEKFWNYPFFKKGDNIMAYKDTISNILDRKYTFLDDYAKNNLVSKEFYDYAKASILNEYISRLYSPLYGQIKKEDIPDGYFDENL